MLPLLCCAWAHGRFLPSDPPLTNKIFEVYHCRKIGPQETILIADHSIRCTVGGKFTEDYFWLWTFADFLVIAWPLGVPALLTFLLWRVRDKIHARDEDTLKLFDFVIGGYEDKYFYWELVELARKLILSGLIGLYGRGSVAQTVLACFVAFFFFAAFYRAQPFIEPMLNTIKGFSEFVIFGVLLVCTVQQVNEANFEEEDIQIATYGSAQSGLCLMYIPVAIIYSEWHAHVHALETKCQCHCYDDVVVS